VKTKRDLRMRRLLKKPRLIRLHARSDAGQSQGGAFGGWLGRRACASGSLRSGRISGGCVGTRMGELDDLLKHGATLSMTANA
jgi:hypothetical protein